MAIYKRGKIYWYKFLFDGQLIRATTKQGNDKIARQMESTERGRLAKERDERKAALLKLNCRQVVRCPECEKFFDAATTLVAGGQQFCSNHCRDTWTKKYRVIPTLGEFCDDRIKPWAKSTYKQATPKTWKWYEFAIGILKQSTIGKGRLEEIGTEKIAEFTSELQRKEFEVSSVNSALRGLRRVLRLAVEWKVIDVAPVVKMMSGERHRERVLTVEEENLYLLVCQPLLHDVSVVLFDTGMRPEECHCMRWETITWANGRHGTILIAKGKTKAARRVLPMTPRVRFMLEDRWKDAGKPAEGWVWPAETKDGRINHDSLKVQHKNALKVSKVRAFEIYSIRHTAMTRLGESGCDVYTLCKIAGWSNIKMALRYVHPSDDAVLNAFSRLGGHKIGHSEELALRDSETQSRTTSTPGGS